MSKLDARYKCSSVFSFIRRVMRHGKAEKAENIVYKAFGHLAEKLGQPTENMPGVLEELLIKLAPVAEARSRKIGGSSYMIPIPVSTKRGHMYASRWILEGARARKRAMHQALADEIATLLEGSGHAFKKRDEKHQMAKANQAFMHLVR